ncbi:uncharacterized protein LOC124157425 isoform X2 [Ischnura elegans]|uniref:uncharacterized protein LOC124157425 isoform X2 n=1 Tax=Ischnura elegans TaxID=197161 RepID=UPI001ED8885C|nr:uncharacterized protein LOC124157425 isoform X2 [Ischnura elegans]
MYMARKCHHGLVNCDVSLVEVITKILHMEKCDGNENELLLCELQKNYENLLMKYAEAENTIDRMKLGYNQRCEEDDSKVMKYRAIGYINDCEVIENHHKETNTRSGHDMIKGTSALITNCGNELGPNSINSLDFCHDPEVLSFIESHSSSGKLPMCFEKSMQSIQKENGSEKSCGTDYYEDNPSQSIGPRTCKLKNNEEHDVSKCPEKNKVNLKATKKALEDIYGTIRDINLKSLKDGSFPLSESDRNLDISYLKKVAPSKKYCHDSGGHAEIGDLLTESMKGKKDRSLQKDGAREKTSTYRYAVVWPIQFETNNNMDPRDGNGLDTCSEPSEGFSLGSCDSISSLEGTSSSAQSEEVLPDADAVSDGNGKDALPPKGNHVRSDFKDELHSKSHRLLELMGSLDRADILASKMKRKSENLKLFLASQLKSIS